MAETGDSGPVIILYGVIIRDKLASADANTLMAYRTVAYDLLEHATGPDADELRATLPDLEQAIIRASSRT